MMRFSHDEEFFWDSAVPVAGRLDVYTLCLGPFSSSTRQSEALRT